MSQDPTADQPVEFNSINTAAELCLYLIMILPDEAIRIARVKDFCRLYDIKERSRQALVRTEPSADDPEPTPAAAIGRIFQKKQS